MKKYILGSIFALLTASAVAENSINIKTKTWKNIPITVDTEKQTYRTMKGYLVPAGEYYYTYSGYRCLKNKTAITGINPVVLKPQNNEGMIIYCYPDK